MSEVIVNQAACKIAFAALVSDLKTVPNFFLWDRIS